MLLINFLIFSYDLIHSGNICIFFFRRPYKVYTDITD